MIDSAHGLTGTHAPAPRPALVRWVRPKIGGLAGWQIGRVQAFMERNLDQSIGVAELAAAARLSSSHFSRAFHVSFAETPYSYLQGLRVRRALTLLQHGALPLCQIATECGFSDQSHFNRVFKKLTGRSPGAWRRAHAEPLRITQPEDIDQAIAFFSSAAGRRITAPGVDDNSKEIS